MSAMSETNAVAAWTALNEGNERFVAGRMEHPHQGADRRSSLTGGQHPIAAVLSCSDSRVAPEIVFDQGLGDIFVVRNAGHVLDAAVLGSLEYAVAVLNVPLVVVLGHESCGAVQATAASVDGGAAPSGHIREVVELLAPSVLGARHAGMTRVDEFVAHHVKETVTQLRIRSSTVALGLTSGSLAVVGATYRLADGRVTVRAGTGGVGEG
jgi:carbonic anhydrase